MAKSSRKPFFPTAFFRLKGWMLFMLMVISGSEKERVESVKFVDSLMLADMLNGVPRKFFLNEMLEDCELFK